MKHIQTRIASLQLKTLSSVRLGYTGRPAFVTEIAGGMERDMTESVGFTAIIIGLLFWLAHRRWIPMLWLVFLLGVILAATLALGGLIFGEINVVSLGFAAILLGLAVDYGVVHYQEALANPDAIVPEIRRAIGPSIFWAAVTTISSFLVLNFSGLPGLGRLGSLVALGVALSAFVMLFIFLPPLFGDRLGRREKRIAEGLYQSSGMVPATRREPVPFVRRAWAMGVSIALALGALSVLLSGLPQLDRTANALRPRQSKAYETLDAIKAHLSSNREPLWILTSGREPAEIARRLDRATSVLASAVSNQLIASYTLPASIWPRLENQNHNRAGVSQIVAERDALRSTALAQGFNTNAWVMMDNIVGTWASLLATDRLVWPTNRMSRWVMEKMVAQSRGDLFAMGFVFPMAGALVNVDTVSKWANGLAREGFLVSGWGLLGDGILRSVQERLWQVVAPMAALVFLSLCLAFRRVPEILLSLAVLGLSGLVLLAVMRLAGWSWNLLNLMSLPLILGSGVDYGIFMQLALRRHAGDWRAAHASVGRALLLCGGTALAGFGSLAFASNAGMASLGSLCAVGIGLNMLISVYLLPVWWQLVAGKIADNDGFMGGDGKGSQRTPSMYYGPALWRAAMVIARVLPASITRSMSRAVCRIYWLFARDRREVVEQNLLPAVYGDRAKAKQTAKSLADEFARKLADLWRYESGCSVEGEFGEMTGWEHFLAGQQRGQGVLLLTPHLGNWEFGAPLLAQRGVKLLVITLAEPGDGFTEMRRASRARWGAETLVIGENPFAFVEIIKRIEAGGTVALLVDRPSAASAVEVELFGQPFEASIAAAELARATGCAVLPVYLPRTPKGYEAHILPEIAYDRRALGDRESRRKLTQQIMRAFEPAIRQHLDQWYHFVSIWPR